MNRCHFRPVRDKNDKIDDGLKCAADFENDGFISHFIYSGPSPFSTIIDEIGRQRITSMIQWKMKKYGLRSAIFTSIYLNRSNIVSKESMKKKYITANETSEADLEMLSRFNRLDSLHIIYSTPRRSVNDDLESLYSNLRNQERKLGFESVVSFMTQMLTEHEKDLIEKRNNDYLKTIFEYSENTSVLGIQIFSRDARWKDGITGLMRLDEDIEKIKKSSVSDSKFLYSLCCRNTFPINVTLKSIREEMAKRALDEDLSDMELTRTLYTRDGNIYSDGKKQYTYKYVKKRKINIQQK